MRVVIVIIVHERMVAFLSVGAAGAGKLENTVVHARALHFIIEHMRSQHNNA